MEIKDVFNTLKKQKGLWLALLGLALVAFMTLWMDSEGGYLNSLDSIPGGDDNGIIDNKIIDLDDGEYGDNFIERNNMYDNPPEMALDPVKDYSATIKTNYGNIVVSLYEDSAPITVNNFVFLAEEGYYDGLVFHRVVEDFVIQGGDPTGLGSGSPGYKFEDETSPEDEFTPYTVAMANSGPNTNGSQFFITTKDSEVNYSALNGNYTIFGKVIDGYETVDKIEKVKVDDADKPIKPVRIEEVTISTR